MPCAGAAAAARDHMFNVAAIEADDPSKIVAATPTASLLSVF